jgi:hypothetical protein
LNPSGRANLQAIEALRKITLTDPSASSHREKASGSISRHPSTSRCDVSNMTATVAAKLLKEIGGMMLKRH